MMTTPGPCPVPHEAPQEGRAVETKRRGLLGFYIATGVVFVLFIAGGFAYKPLKLRYAMHRVRTRDASFPLVGESAKWFEMCELAARRGDPRAAETVVDYLLREGSGGESPELFGLVDRQPDLLFSLLEKRTDREAKRALARICCTCARYANWGRKLPMSTPLTADDYSLYRLEGDLKEAERCPEKSVGRVAWRSGEYLRRRFAEELDKQ